ncbi:hypothetical protein MRX96_019411 [Rhipicephalus microplus]
MVMPNANNEQLHSSNHREDSLRSADSRQTASQHRSPVATSHARRNSSSSCYPSLLFCPVIASAVTGTAIFLQFFNTSTDMLPDDPDTQSYTRIMDAMLQMLWRTGNSTLDPCKDFYRYVCYNYFDVHTENAYFNAVQSPHLVLQGISSNAAGRALFAYYRSCIFSQRDPADSLKEALRALLQVMYVSLDMTSLQMLVLVIKLSLVYGIRTDPLVYQNFQRRQPAVVINIIETDGLYDSLSLDGPQDLFILSDKSDICGNYFDSAAFKKIYSMGLTELITLLNLNVTFNQVVDFAAEFCRVTNDGSHIKANDAILGSIMNGVSARLWKNIIEGYTNTAVNRLILSPADVLKHRFALLTNRTLQPVAMVLIVLHASFVLSLDTEEEKSGTSDRYAFCLLSSYGMNPLWMLSHIMSLRLPNEHNSVVMRIFNTLVETIGTEIDEKLTFRLPFPASTLLKKIILVLPHYLYPLNTVIPKLDSSFFSNTLKLQKHRLDYWSYQAPPGIPRRLPFYLHPKHGVQSGCFMVLPLLVYSAVALQRTMTVLPMAVLGFVIADNLWTDCAQYKLDQFARYHRQEFFVQ